MPPSDARNWKKFVKWCKQNGRKVNIDSLTVYNRGKADLKAAAKYLTNDAGICIDTQAQEDVLRGLSEEDPGEVLSALLDQLGKPRA